MDHGFDHSVFAKNRQRLLDADVAREFLLEIVGQAREQRLLSEEHFSVDGTLLEAGASVRVSGPTTTDPEARLAKKGKGKEAKLCFGAHVLLDNRDNSVSWRFAPTPACCQSRSRRQQVIPDPHPSPGAASPRE